MKPKYDWLHPRNRWTDIKVEFEGDEWSELDALPTGWYIAFGEQMVDELNAILIKYNFADEYRIMQIKEKFGGLRWYDNGFPHEGYEEYCAWSNKYEDLSERTCIICGEPGVMRYGGWISPYCDKHANGAPEYDINWEDDEDEIIEGEKTKAGIR